MHDSMSAMLEMTSFLKPDQQIKPLGLIIKISRSFVMSGADPITGLFRQVVTDVDRPCMHVPLPSS